MFIHHMRRSSLGSGRGKPGLSDPAEPTCLLSSALGLYVPSIRRFFRMTQKKSSKARLSRESAAENNADVASGTEACAAMVTAFLRSKKYGSGAAVM